MIAVEFQGARGGPAKLEAFLRSHNLPVVESTVVGTHLERRGTVDPDYEALVHVVIYVAGEERARPEGAVSLAEVVAVVDRFKRSYGRPMRVSVVDQS